LYIFTYYAIINYHKYTGTCYKDIKCCTTFILVIIIYKMPCTPTELFSVNLYLYTAASPDTRNNLFRPLNNIFVFIYIFISIFNHFNNTIYHLSVYLYMSLYYFKVNKVMIYYFIMFFIGFFELALKCQSIYLWMVDGFRAAFVDFDYYFVISVRALVLPTVKLLSVKKGIYR